MKKRCVQARMLFNFVYKYALHKIKNTSSEIRKTYLFKKKTSAPKQKCGTVHMLVNMCEQVYHSCSSRLKYARHNNSMDVQNNGRQNGRTTENIYANSPL